ncbi:Free methionine-R-sulfoxide reductase [compost metagenome]
MVLGPFQGPIACTRIGFGKGVCGTSWKQQEIIIVDNVEEFPGHIACSSLSKSEIVVPVLKNGIVVAVLDIDSDELAQFDETDATYLEQIVSLLKF